MWRCIFIIVLSTHTFVAKTFATDCDHKLNPSPILAKDDQGHAHLLTVKYESGPGHYLFFGYPFKKGDDYFLLGAGVDRLREVSMRSFYKGYARRFFEYHISESPYLLAPHPKNKGEFEFLRITSQSKKDVTGFLLDGRKVTRPLYEMFAWNWVFLYSGDLTAIRDFFLDRGRGRIVFFENENPYLRGPSIIVETLPDRQRIFNLSANTFAMVHNLFQDGTALIYKNMIFEQGQFGVAAATLPANNFSLKRLSQQLNVLMPNGAIVFTPQTKDYVLVHEKQHYDDYRSGVTAPLLDLLGKDEFTETAGRRIYQALLEQRAYARALEYLSGHPEPEQEMLKDVLEAFDQFYVNPSIDTLKFLARDHREIFDRLIRILKELQLPSKEIDLAEKFISAAET